MTTNELNDDIRTGTTGGTDNKRLHIKGIARKRGLTPRLYLFLADGEPHYVGEFYDWLVDAVEPPAAIRKYLNSISGNRRGNTQLMTRQRRATEDPEWVVAEGRRSTILTTIHHCTSEGFVNIVYKPEPEERDVHLRGSVGFIDPRKMILQLTEKGRQHFLTGDGVFTKCVSELLIGLSAGKLHLSVRCSGKQQSESSTKQTDHDMTDEAVLAEVNEALRLTPDEVVAEHPNQSEQKHTEQDSPVSKTPLLEEGFFSQVVNFLQPSEERRGGR